MNEQTEERTIHDLAREMIYILKDLERDYGGLNVWGNQRKAENLKGKIESALHKMDTTLIDRTLVESVPDKNAHSTVAIMLSDHESLLCDFREGLLKNFRLGFITAKQSQGKEQIRGRIVINCRMYTEGDLYTLIKSE